MRTHFKSTETFQYIHFTSSHPPGVKKGFIKGEALRLLRTNSSKKIFEEKIKTFKSHLIKRGYPENLIQATLSEVRFEERKLALQPKQRENKRILPFVTQYQPSVQNLKQILMKKWHLPENNNHCWAKSTRNRPSFHTKEGVRSKTYRIYSNKRRPRISAALN